jgi:hypothetical protein
LTYHLRAPDGSVHTMQAENSMSARIKLINQLNYSHSITVYESIKVIKTMEDTHADKL